MNQKEIKKLQSIRDYKAAAWALTKAQFKTVWPIFLCATLLGLPAAYDSLISQLPFGDEQWLKLIELAVQFVGGTFLTSALTIGIAVVSMRMVLEQPVSLRTLFVGFRQRYWKNVWLHVSTFLVVAGWTLLLIVPGIIKGFSYAMTNMVFIENPHMTPKEARRESARMMKGHKYYYFELLLSFFGWMLLDMLTLHVSALWTAPYINAATTYFYQSLKDHQSPKGNLTTDAWEE